jgi:predicted PurR-regulated permease PerM
MTWALILAVTLYPLHQSVAAKIGGRQGLAATLLVLLGIVVVVVPTAALMNSLGDSVHRLVNDVRNNTLQVPPPRAGVAEWPLVGERVHAFWTKAHTDLPALVQSMQPKIGNLATAALGFVAGIGGGLLQLLASLVVAGIMMAFGEEERARYARSSRDSPTGSAEQHSSTCPPRPSARSPKECWASRSYRPSSSASACSSPAYRGQAC